MKHQLHFIKARMRGGLLNKAKRGELKTSLPIGLVYDEQDQVILDPDLQVQESIHQLFRTFKRTGSAFATVKSFRKHGIKVPCRIQSGVHKGEVHWREPMVNRVLSILHNPRYAGVYCYGREQYMKGTDGKTKIQKRSQEEWHAFIKDMHPGYIT